MSTPNDISSQELDSLLENYEPSEETKALVKANPPILLVGVSGAGKGTLKEELLETGDFYHLISNTSRPPRENNGVMEIDGVEYHFTTLSEAKTMLENGEFVEANVYSGNVYGTTADEIKKATEEGKRPLTDIEVQGVADYMEISPDVTAIFILPYSFEAWGHRLVGRGDMDKEIMMKRLKTAPHELRTALDESRYAFVINSTVDEMVADAKKIIENGEVDPGKQQAGRELAQKLLDQTVQFLEKGA